MGELSDGTQVGGDTSGTSVSDTHVESVVGEPGAGGTTISQMPDAPESIGGDGSEFIGLLDDFDDSDSVNSGDVVPSVSDKPTDSNPVVQTKAPDQKQAQTPQVQPPALQTQQVEPPAPVPQPGQGQSQAGATEPQSQLGAPANFIETLNANREQFRASLAEQFKLDEATITELETDAAAAIPKVMADLYLRVMAGVYNILDRGLPNMIDSHSSRVAGRKEVETKFYGKFPELQKPEYSNAILGAVKQVKQMFPQDSQDQVMDRVGRMVMAAYGIAQSAPAQRSAPSRARKAAPFTPAVGSPGPVREQGAPPVDTWTDMSQAFLTDFTE